MVPTTLMDTWIAELESVGVAVNTVRCAKPPVAIDDMLTSFQQQQYSLASLGMHVLL